MRAGRADRVQTYQQLEAAQAAHVTRERTTRGVENVENEETKGDPPSVVNVPRLDSLTVRNARRHDTWEDHERDHEHAPNRHAHGPNLLRDRPHAHVVVTARQAGFLIFRVRIHGQSRVIRGRVILHRLVRPLGSRNVILGEGHAHEVKVGHDACDQTQGREDVVRNGRRLLQNHTTSVSSCATLVREHGSMRVCMKARTSLLMVPMKIISVTEAVMPAKPWPAIMPWLKMGGNMLHHCIAHDQM